MQTMLSSVKTSVGKRPRHTHHLSTGSLPLAATERRDSCCDREWTPAATEKTSTRQAVTLKGPSVSERKRWRGAWPARERDLRGNLQDGKQRTPATQSAEPPARGRRGVSLRMRCMQPSAASTQTMPARPPETKAPPPPPSPRYTESRVRSECVPSVFRPEPEDFFFEPEDTRALPEDFIRAFRLSPFSHCAPPPSTHPHPTLRPPRPPPPPLTPTRRAQDWHGKGQGVRVSREERD